MVFLVMLREMRMYFVPLLNHCCYDREVRTAGKGRMTVQDGREQAYTGSRHARNDDRIVLEL